MFNWVLGPRGGGAFEPICLVLSGLQREHQLVTPLVQRLTSSFTGNDVLQKKKSPQDPIRSLSCQIQLG